MAQNSIIRQLLAGFLLFVFAFSITPKQFLHDAIANHKDKIAAASADAQFSHAGFICKCDNLVAESPFTNDIIYFDFAPAPFFSVQKGTNAYHFYSSTYFFFELRGPPAVNKQYI